MKKDLELYLHIPFCVKKCNYCDFLSAPADDTTREQYTRALCREISSYEGLFEQYRISSIFFGGGTPSLLTGTQFERIMNAIQTTFPVPTISKDDTARQSVLEPIEVTVECNPGTLSQDLLSIYYKNGVNRLSIGLQSAEEEELRKLGRIHSYQDFVESYQLARETGFTNINVDLMQSLPGQTADGFLRTLNKVISLAPEHISVYSLIIEEGTPFYEWYHENEDKLPTEEEERSCYLRSELRLRESGYEHYEISNYAKPGYECRHNCGYWTGVEYLGLGLGAASYLNETRFQQTNHLQQYLENPNPQKMERQKLTLSERMEEFMFLGLRLSKGISKTGFTQRFQKEYQSVYGEPTKRLVKQGFLVENDDQVALTERGRDLSNRILAEFLLESE